MKLRVAFAAWRDGSRRHHAVKYCARPTFNHQTSHFDTAARPPASCWTSRIKSLWSCIFTDFAVLLDIAAQHRFHSHQTCTLLVPRQLLHTRTSGAHKFNSFLWTGIHLFNSHSTTTSPGTLLRFPSVLRARYSNTLFQQHRPPDPRKLFHSSPISNFTFYSCHR